MNTFLRRVAEWRGRRSGASVIVFDGAAEVEKTRAFAKGAIVGVIAATVVLALTAPTRLSPSLMEQMQRREALLEESNHRAKQAMQVADVCLSTARELQRTLAGYQSFLGGGPPEFPTAPPAGMSR